MRSLQSHSVEAPSVWVMRWAGLIKRGPVLDVACGQGRHARMLAERGLEVVAVDRDEHPVPAGVRFVQADLEGGASWPFEGQRFAGIIVTHYLYRPLFAKLAAALDEGGVLIYETFMSGNERYGRPSRPDFLLRPGELLEVFKALTVVAFEQGLVEQPRKAAIQRLCALRGPVESAKISR